MQTNDERIIKNQVQNYFSDEYSISDQIKSSRRLNRFSKHGINHGIGMFNMIAQQNKTKERKLKSKQDGLHIHSEHSTAEESAMMQHRFSLLDSSRINNLNSNGASANAVQQLPSFHEDTIGASNAVYMQNQAEQHQESLGYRAVSREFKSPSVAHSIKVPSAFHLRNQSLSIATRESSSQEKNLTSVQNEKPLVVFYPKVAKILSQKPFMNKTKSMRQLQTDLHNHLGGASTDTTTPFPTNNHHHHQSTRNANQVKVVFSKISSTKNNSNNASYFITPCVQQQQIQQTQMPQQNSNQNQNPNEQISSTTQKRKPIGQNPFLQFANNNIKLSNRGNLDSPPIRKYSHEVTSQLQQQQLSQIQANANGDKNINLQQQINQIQIVNSPMRIRFSELVPFVGPNGKFSEQMCIHVPTMRLCQLFHQKGQIQLQDLSENEQQALLKRLQFVTQSQKTKELFLQVLALFFAHQIQSQSQQDEPQINKFNLETCHQNLNNSSYIHILCEYQPDLYSLFQLLKVHNTFPEQIIQIIAKGIFENVNQILKCQADQNDEDNINLNFFQLDRIFLNFKGRVKFFAQIDNLKQDNNVANSSQQNYLQDVGLLLLQMALGLSFFPDGAHFKEKVRTSEHFHSCCIVHSLLEMSKTQSHKQSQKKNLNFMHALFPDHDTLLCLGYMIDQTLSKNFVDFLCSCFHPQGHLLQQFTDGLHHPFLAADDVFQQQTDQNSLIYITPKISYVSLQEFIIVLNNNKSSQNSQINNEVYLQTLCTKIENLLQKSLAIWFNGTLEGLRHRKKLLSCIKPDSDFISQCAAYLKVPNAMCQEQFSRVVNNISKNFMLGVANVRSKQFIYIKNQNQKRNALFAPVNITHLNETNF